MLQAEILKTPANPSRIQILHALADGPIGVGRIAKQIGDSQPSVSRHLAVLRSARLVDSERDGREVYYRLSDPDVMVGCGILRSVLERRLSRLGRIAAASSNRSTPDPSDAPSLRITATSR